MYCTKCHQEGHLAGKCPQITPVPARKNPPPKFEKKSELSRLCDRVIQSGLATGHADTIEDLVQELIAQAKTCPECAKRRRQTRERVRRFREKRHAQG